MTRRRSNRRARGRDWFEGSRVSAWSHLASLLGICGGVAGAFVAAHHDSGRWFSSAVFVAAASTWSPSFEAADAAHWQFGFQNSWTNTRFTVWLLFGGGVQSAVTTARHDVREVPD